MLGFDKAQYEYDNEIPEPQYSQEITYCKICNCYCKHEICNSCVDDAIINSKTRLAYINSNSDFCEDWNEYTNHYWDNKINQNIDILTDEDCGLIASMAWVNEDRSDFEEWLIRRNK